MAAVEPGKIRNVAVVGHRGTGKTSLVEAMLFQSGQVNRLGTIDAASTVSDWDDEEHRRSMSLSASVCHGEWQGRKLNLVDAPGDPGFQGDALVVGEEPTTPSEVQDHRRSAEDGGDDAMASRQPAGLAG